MCETQLPPLPRHNQGRDRRKVPHQLLHTSSDRVTQHSPQRLQGRGRGGGTGFERRDAASQLLLCVEGLVCVEKG